LSGLIFLLHPPVRQSQYAVGMSVGTCAGGFERLLSPLDRLRIMALPIFIQSFADLEEGNCGLVSGSTRERGVDEVANHLQIRFGGGKKQAGLRHLVGNIDVASLRSCREKSFAELLIGGAV